MPYNTNLALFILNCSTGGQLSFYSPLQHSLTYIDNVEHEDDVCEDCEDDEDDDDMCGNHM